MKEVKHMKMFEKCRFWLVCAMVLLVTDIAQATPYVPPSVAPGSAYHLAFATRDVRDATSSLISNYNTFVNNQAGLNPILTGTNMGVQYKVIGSTATVNALVNAPVTASVYNFIGNIIATHSADLWDGSILNPIEYDQFANSGFPDLWTGTDFTGIADAGFELGSATPRSGLAGFGVTNQRWIDDGVSGKAQKFRFYALSQQLIAPQSTVASPSMFIFAFFGLIWAGVLRHKRR
jgi:hypothetical protein